MKIENQEVEKIIQNSDFPKESERICEYTFQELKKENLKLTNLQYTLLSNHLAEMVSRSMRNEKLAKVDDNLFNEVSNKSLNLARKIVGKIGNLASSESLVLSIHFENARKINQ